MSDKMYKSINHWFVKNSKERCYENLIPSNDTIDLYTIRRDGQSGCFRAAMVVDNGIKLFITNTRWSIYKIQVTTWLFGGFSGLWAFYLLICGSLLVQVIRECIWASYWVLALWVDFNFEDWALFKFKIITMIKTSNFS